MIDGWVKIPEHDSDYRFDDLEAAKVFANRKYAELDESNKKAGEHYGVIDMWSPMGKEVYCTGNK